MSLYAMFENLKTKSKSFGARTGSTTI